MPELLIKMAKLKIRGKDLVKLGFPDERVVGVAINMALKYCKRQTVEEVLATLKLVLAKPESYLDHPHFAMVAEELVEVPEEVREEKAIAATPLAYKAFGSIGIDEKTVAQMDIAMRLPVTQAGALMPDAHLGYGLPIGGVLAVKNAVIPYAVGMDIGCRMCLTVYDYKPKFLKVNTKNLLEILKQNTRFGSREFERPMDDAVLARPEFDEIPFLKPLKGKARKQIGSSGSGNHFVEFGQVQITEQENDLGLPVGEYVGILSHSGSRGFGAYIARHYTQVAMDTCYLPKEAKHLAWLDLDSEAGMEYWLAMNLAGDYAAACHAHIHKRLGAALGERPIATVENHHNFAWKETLADGQEVIVHRKGATPAGKGVLGIIPGSMTAPAFIVRGKGEPHSLNSASHGAGRKMSRTKAKMSTTRSALKKHLAKHEVSLIGGGLDEAPFAYKDINEVMRHQQDLVEVLGTFLPKIVRMDR